MERTIDRNAMLAELRGMDPIDFEQLIAEVYRHRGHEAELTESTNDGGRDVIVHPRFRPGRTLVQIKRYSESTKVNSGHVQKYSGLFAEPGFVFRVLVVTTGPVTNEGVDLADRRGVEIVDEDTVVEWLLEKDPQLAVLSRYIDADAVVEGGWNPVSRPSLRAPLLLVGGFLALLVAFGIAAWRLGTGPTGPVTQSTAELLTVPFALGSVLATAGVSVALSELLRGRYLVAGFTASVLAIGHVGGLVTSLVWGFDLFRDAVAGTVSAISRYSLAVPGTGVSVSVPVRLVQVGVFLPVVVTAAFVVGLLWLRRRQGYTFSIER